MNSVAERILDMKLIDNQRYLNALNTDYEKLPDVYEVIREKIWEIIDLDDALNGEMTNKRVHQCRKELRDFSVENQYKDSALIRWVYYLLRDLERVTQKDKETESEYDGDGIHSDITRKQNGKIFKIFRRGKRRWRVVKSAIRLVEDNYEDLSVNNVSNIVNCVARLGDNVINKNREAIKYLLGLLLIILKDSKTELRGVDIGCLLYGLRRLDSTMVSKEWFEVMADKIEDCDAEIKGKHLSMALFGLQNFSGDMVPKRLLLAIANKINESNDLMTDQGIGMSLYGLMNLDGESVPVELLDILAVQVELLEGKMETKALSMAIYGMQNLTDDYISRELLSALLVQLEKIVDELNVQTIANALYGMIQLRSDEAILISDLLIRRLEAFDVDKDLNVVDVKQLVQVFSMMGMECPADIERRYHEIVSGENRAKPRYWSENKIYKFLRKILHKRIIFNTYVDGFELDFYIPEFNLNVEVDGSHHDRKAFKDRKRDDYLRAEHHMQIFRIKMQRGWKDELKGFLEEVTA